MDWIQDEYFLNIFWKIIEFLSACVRNSGDMYLSPPTGFLQQLTSDPVSIGGEVEGPSIHASSHWSHGNQSRWCT